MTDPVLVATARDLEERVSAAHRHGHDRYGTIRADREGTLAVRISPPLIPRAMDILLRVSIRAVERGWALVGRTFQEHPGLRVDQTLVAFRLAEVSKGTKIKRAIRQKNYWTSAEYRYAPQGKLRLELNGYFPDKEVRRFLRNAS